MTGVATTAATMARVAIRAHKRGSNTTRRTGVVPIPLGDEGADMVRHPRSPSRRWIYSRLVAQ
jgi:hypothetical protein